MGSGTVPLVAVCVLFAAAARSGQRDEEQHADKLHFEIKMDFIKNFYRLAVFLGASCKSVCPSFKGSIFTTTAQQVDPV